MKQKRLKEDIIKSEEAYMRALTEELRKVEGLENILRMRNEELMQKKAEFEDLCGKTASVTFENVDLRRKMELQERELEVSRDLRKILLSNTAVDGSNIPSNAKLD